jgi:hypothetical protein
MCGLLKHIGKHSGFFLINRAKENMEILHTCKTQNDGVWNHCSMIATPTNAEDLYLIEATN